MKKRELERFEAHGLEWVAVSDFAEVVKGDARTADGSGLEVVKAGPARRVWRFEAGGEEVYVKECLVPEMRDRLKYTCQSSKAWKEWNTLRELSARGVAVPEALAVGVRRCGGMLERSILVTRGLGEVVPLVKYVLERIETAGHGEVKAFTERFAEFVRGLHDRGLFHKDFHAGNIMAGGEGGEAEFSLVDLADTRVGGELQEGERLENIAVLGHFFCQVAPRHWRLRFFKGYLGARGDWRGAARLVEEAAEAGMRNVWDKRDRRAFGENKYFRHVRTGRLIGHARRGEVAAAAVRLFEGGDPFDKAEEILKSSRSSKVGVFAVEAGGRRVKVVVKRRNPRRGWKALLDPFRMSRGKRGFFYGAAFENRRVATPRVLAALDERCLGCIKASYLVLEYLEGAENLAAVAAAGEKSALGGRLLAEGAGWWRGLAHYLRRMHWCGFSVRDLKTANVLLWEEEGRLELAVGDLDDARLYRGAAPEGTAMKNLARLCFDLEWLGVLGEGEREAFVREYLGPCGKERAARWLRGIERHMRRKGERFKPKGVFAQRGAGG